MSDVFGRYRPQLVLDAAHVDEDTAAAVAEGLTARGWPAHVTRYPSPAVVLDTERGKEVAVHGQWIVCGPHGPFLVDGDTFPGQYQPVDET